MIDPWILGSADENDVQGQGATPININNFTFGYQADVGAAGVTFVRPKRYWVSVDSNRGVFTERRGTARTCSSRGSTTSTRPDQIVDPGHRRAPADRRA